MGPADTEVIEGVVNKARHNIIGYRNIYLVSYTPSLVVPNTKTIDETIFPFTKATVVAAIKNEDRAGWYLQQLIKLYAGFVIDGILPNYLVIDSDTYFLRPTQFFDENIPLYNIGWEYHVPYFEHMSRLHPSLRKQSDYSGICHHMMFQRDKVAHLFSLVEEYHATNQSQSQTEVLDTKPMFYRIFLDSIDSKYASGSGASEYEIYFNFLLLYYPYNVGIRLLNWCNTYMLTDDPAFDYISYHWYMRPSI